MWILSSLCCFPCRKALLNAFVHGVTYAISQSTIFLMYGVIFRFGAFQVVTTSIAHADFDSVFVAFTALVFGAIGAGQAGAFAPNYAKAKLSANRIFFLLDKIPLIDGYSADGIKPVSYCVQLVFLTQCLMLLHDSFTSHTCLTAQTV